jgi:hypothetical protein
MSQQVLASPNNKKISELYRRIKQGSLILQPDFQRRLVWNSGHKEEFIDTIINGYPFPEIYIAQSGVDIEKNDKQEVVIDGQQRISTILQYIDDTNSNNFGKKVKRFNELTTQEKRAFLDYNVVVRDLGDMSPQTIKEVFRRINRTRYGLNSVEIHEELYDGEFIKTAQEILSHIELEQFPVFSESDLSRMADLHFILLIMSTLENGGYFLYDKELERYITRYNDTYERSEERKKVISETFEFIREVELRRDSMWFRKSNFFTMFIELLKSQKVSAIEIKKSLNDFEEKVIKNKDLPKEQNDYSLYYSYMYTETNSRKARVIRSDVFNKYVL